MLAGEKNIRDNKTPSMLIWGLLFFFFLLSIIFLISFPPDRQFIHLAQSFFNGKVNLDQTANMVDIAIFQNSWYWPLGPVPALLYVPFIPIITANNWWDLQLYTTIFFTILNGWLLYGIARAFKLSHNQSLWMVFAFLFSTAYIGIAFISANSYLSHAVATTLIFGALYEFFTRKRFWLIGLLMGLALGTRATAGLGIVFFLLSILFDKISTGGKGFSVASRLRSVVMLLLPFFACVVALAWYNFARFGDLFETGYRYSIIGPAMTVARDIGLFHIAHVSRNLHYFLFGLPYIVQDARGNLRFPYLSINRHGMSILLTSAYLIFLARASWKKWLNIKLFITSIIIFIPLMLLFTTGFMQYGYRFALDFLPYLFIIFIYSCATQKIILSDNIKMAIALNGLLNLYLITFGTYFR